MDEDRDAFEAINAHMLRFLPELVAELGGEAPDSSTSSGWLWPGWLAHSSTRCNASPTCAARALSAARTETVPSL